MVQNIHNTTLLQDQWKVFLIAIAFNSIECLNSLVVVVETMRSGCGRVYNGVTSIVVLNVTHAKQLVFIYKFISTSGVVESTKLPGIILPVVPKMSRTVKPGDHNSLFVIKGEIF